MCSPSRLLMINSIEGKKHLSLIRCQSLRIRNPVPMLSHSTCPRTFALNSWSFLTGSQLVTASHLRGSPLSSPNQLSPYKGVPKPMFSSCFRASALNSPSFLTRLGWLQFYISEVSHPHFCLPQKCSRLQSSWVAGGGCFVSTACVF